MALENNNCMGQRLLVPLVDEWAEREPKKKFCSIPKGQDVSDGFQDVSFNDVAHATDYMSWWMEHNLGCSKTNEIVAYIGSNDIRYIIFSLSCHKTGYKPFLPSTRNSEEAFRYLLKATECTKLIYSVDLKEKALTIQNCHSKIQLFEIPSWDEMLTSERIMYPYNKTYLAEEDKVSLVLHTSGTTGQPKPIYLTHGYFGTVDITSQVLLPPGRLPALPFANTSKRGLVLSVTPFFHVMGFAAFMQAILRGIPFAYPPPNKPLSNDILVEVMRQLDFEAAILPPSLVENMCKSAAGLGQLSRLKYLYFGGGPLSPEIGDSLQRRVNLVSIIGSTEMGPLLSMIPEDKSDWSYFEWAPALGLLMDHIGDDIYELVVQRGKDRKLHGIFHTFPDLVEYRSKDLYICHPTKEGLWKYHGRMDDIIVLSNGEKFNPITMEKTIEGHPLISKALVVGQGRFQAGLLIEPNRDMWENGEWRTVDDFLDVIWPKIQEANEGVPMYGRVMRNRIGIASKDKPFRTTQKGTLQRRLIDNDYKEEIGALYEKEFSIQVELPKDPTLSSLTKYIRSIVTEQLQKDINNTDDLYAAGYDSLQTTYLTNVLNSTIHSRDEGIGHSITMQAVYTHNTIMKLAQYITEILNGETNNSILLRLDRINILAENYTKDLPARTTQLSRESRAKKHTVILTGSTGSIGSYLLSTLLNDMDVCKIYCLNRSPDSELRQRKLHHEKGLCSLEDNSKVEFVQAAFGEDKQGLSTPKYNELLGAADIIILNAWEVNFNLPVEHFDFLLRSVRGFIDFSLQSKLRPHIFFISSISSVGAWDSSMGPSAPETIVSNPDATLKQGYAESKHLAERLCYEAANRSSTPTTVLRVGQVAGPTHMKGIWNQQEWVPALIATSKSIGKLPGDLGAARVDWIPVDTLAEIVRDIIHSRIREQQIRLFDVFNLVNPNPISWSVLTRPIKTKYNIKSVPLPEWVLDLENFPQPTLSDLREKPALKLMDFYRSLQGRTSPCLITVKKAKMASRTMMELPPVSESLMENWLGQWAF